MKEKLYTLDLMDAVKSGGECLFCWLERKLEQTAVEFVLGSSYMESDIREQTDRAGFCRNHTKIMYDYGNSLGNAWILKSRTEYVRRHLKKAMDSYAPQKPGWLDRMKKARPAGGPVSDWIHGQEEGCYICARIRDTYDRMLRTFVHLLREEPEFEPLLMESRGFCIHHFADVIDICDRSLTDREKQRWMPKLFALTERNLERIQEEIDWLIEKYDYKNQDADWKDSRDAVQRTMQKLTGGYPADPVFKSK